MIRNSRRLALLALGLAVSPVSPAPKDMKIAAGIRHVLAIGGDALSAAGYNQDGALGLGSTTQFITPQSVGSGYRHVAAGMLTSFAIKSDSGLWAWGNGSYGIQGNGLNIAVLSPTRVGGAKWITVKSEMTSYSAMGIQADSTLWGWGWNEYGNVGDGTGTQRWSPVKVGAAKWLDVDPGYYHTLAIKSDSTLWAWGDNTYGVLGDNSHTSTITPKQIGTGKWLMAEASAEDEIDNYDVYSIGIKSDSTLWSWGGNYSSQLGLGDQNERLIPTQVGSAKWLAVSAGGAHVLAIKSDSTLWGWGQNYYGQLGTGNATFKASPFQIGALKWKSVFAGQISSYGVDASGNYYSWGVNYSGMLGANGTTLRNSPGTFAPIKGSQTLTFGVLPSKMLADADFSPGATSSAGLSVSYASSNTAAATIVNGKIHIVGLGVSTITASQAGDAGVNAATNATQSFTVAKPNQTVAFTSAGTLTHGQTLTLSVSAQGSGAVTYSVDNGSLASVSGAVLTALSGTGSVTVTASVAADANYNAGSATQVVALGKADPGITLTNGDTLAFGATLTLVASASGTGAVSYSVGAGPANLSGNVLTPASGTGTVTVTAAIAADANYSAGSSSQTITLKKGVRADSFVGDTTLAYGAKMILHTSHSHAGTMAYSVDDGSLAGVSGDTLTAYSGTGSVTVTGVLAATADYIAETSTKVVTLQKANQAISFTNGNTLAYGATLSLGASASGTGAVAYAVASGPATVSGGTLTPSSGTGTVTVTATIAADANYNSASTSQAITLQKAAQAALAFGSIGAVAYGDGPVTLTVSGGSGAGAVSYSVNNGSIASISSDAMTLLGVGTIILTAAKASDANYNSITVLDTLTVAKASQTLFFPSLSAKAFGDADFDLMDSTSSGLEVVYSSSNASVATVSGRTVHIVGGGSTTITARQAGNANYDSAGSVAQTLTVGKQSQSIIFPAFSAKNFGDADFALVDSSSSGLGVAYSSSNSAVATVSGFNVHIVGAGSTTITARQAGNANYDSAASASRTLTVGRKSQAITFSALTDKMFGDADFILPDSASSGLAVAYASSNTAAATISGRTVHIVGAGTATLTASQPGNAFYAAAADVSRTLAVAKADQTLAFASLPGKIPGDADFAPGAVSSAGLPVSYSSSDTLVAALVDGLIRVVGPGNAAITARQAGNGNYNGAADTAQTLHVERNGQTIAFGALPAKTFGDSDFEVAAAAGSGLAVTLASANPAVATVVSGKIHIVGAGTAVITASQAGSAGYGPAADVAQNLVVAKTAQTLTVAALGPKTYGDSDFTVGAASSSGLAPSFTLSDSLVAILVAGKLRLLGEGTAQITWTQGGDANHLAADPVSQTLVVGRASQSIAFDLGADTLKTLGERAFAVHAASSAGLPVSFSSSDSALAAIHGDSVRILGMGVVTITAAQSGSARYAQAAPVTRQIRIRAAAPSAFLAAELSPAAGMPVDTAVELSWPAKAGALAYRVQATLDTSLPASLADTSVNGTSILLRKLAFGVRIHWRISASNATGSSAFSPYASLDVRPLPPASVDVARIPAFPEGGVGKQVEIAWPKVEGSTGYRVQVSLDIALPPLIDTIVSSPTLSLSDLPAGSTRNWRVAPVNGASQAAFIPWLTFKVRDKVEDAVTRSAVVDSAKPEPVQVSALVGVTPKDNGLSGVKIILTEERQAPSNLPAGFLPLTGRIELNAKTGSGGGSIEVGDNQISITLTAPDTLLDGTKVGSGEEPMVYLLDSATGELSVLYDLKKDSLGRIILPLSKGKSFMLAVDTVAPVIKDATLPETRESGSSPVISGRVDDNIRNSRAWLRYRQGGSENFDSVAVVIDGTGRFEMPLDLELDGTGFEYNLVASDGRNRKATQSLDLPVSVKGLHAADSLPSRQWRLFALPTIANANDWADMSAALGTYGLDWKLFERAPEGLREFGSGLKSAKPGYAYWLKSRTRSFRPAITGGIAASISKPFVIAFPPKSWRSFGNPYLFPIAWRTVLDSSRSSPGAADALVGPYTFRDSSWISPLEIPALEPWEGYYAYNPTNDTVYMRIPSIRAKAAPAPLAKAAFHLHWQVRGADGKDAGNFFGALPLPEKPVAKIASQAGAEAAPYRTSAVTSFWNLPKPEAPDAGLRVGFVAPDASGGLLQTDFRDVPAQSGSTWTARLDGLKQGQRYASRFLGLNALPEGVTVGLADPATGYFALWSPDMAYVVEAKEGETARELQVYAGTAEYVEALGLAFEAAHPSRIELGNYPNPIRDYTVVRFAVPVSASTPAPKVKMTVYDMQGRRIKVLLAAATAAGRHSLRWDARDDGGRRVAAGNYRLLLEVGGKRMNRALQIAY
jgi:alpha-tubulin suppressor-like RCC1 family protein